MTGAFSICIVVPDEAFQQAGIGTRSVPGGVTDEKL
jgi:hypothetical protein